MAGLVVGLIAAVIVLCVVIAMLANRILSLQADTTSEHAKCVAHIASVTSDRMVAVAFRDAADRWDSVEEQPNLGVIRRQYKPNGPSVAALWLRQHADRLDP